jgi:hypothetical protein
MDACHVPLRLRLCATQDGVSRAAALACGTYPHAPPSPRHLCRRRARGACTGAAAPSLVCVPAEGAVWRTSPEACVAVNAIGGRGTQGAARGPPLSEPPARTTSTSTTLLAAAAADGAAVGALPSECIVVHAWCHYYSVYLLMCMLYVLFMT